MCVCVCVGMQSEVVSYFQRYDELWKQQDARVLVESTWTTDVPFFIPAGLPEVHGCEGNSPFNTLLGDLYSSGQLLILHSYY